MQNSEQWNSEKQRRKLTGNRDLLLNFKDFKAGGEPVSSGSGPPLQEVNLFHQALVHHYRR